jgi:outer membrane immunogenic protein
MEAAARLPGYEVPAAPQTAETRARRVAFIIAVQSNLMKRLALVVALCVGSGSATLAADLPPAPTPIGYPPAVPAYNWTGVYIGGNVGLGWSWDTFSDTLGNSLNLPNSAQILGGGQVGFNYEFYTGFLIGAEADFDWLANTTNTSASFGLSNPAGTPTGSNATISAKDRCLTTVTGRAGYAWDRLLVYTKAGGAWVGTASPTLTVNGAPVAISTSGSNWGWTAGIGLEWAFWNNWSTRIEFDYVGLANQSFTIPAAAGGLPAGDQFTSNNRYLQVVNVGVNYKFGNGL